MSMDNIQLKQENVLDDEVVLSDINPITNTKSIDDSATGAKLSETLDRIWNTINNKLTRVVNSVNGRTGVVVLTSEDVGLGNVDNVSYAEIKNWVIETFENMFKDMRLQLYETLSQVVLICETNDRGYMNVPFYCDQGIDDRRAYIGFYFWDDTSGTLQHMEKPINTIGYTDNSILYNEAVNDVDVSGGGIAVNIHKDEEALYLHNGPSKAESGLRIDGSKIVGNLYYCDGMYGNGTNNDVHALLSFDSSTRGDRVHIRFDGVEISDELYLRKNSEIKIKTGDLILSNFKPYKGKTGLSGYERDDPSSPANNGMSMRLMYRRPALGYVISCPTFEHPEDEYIIDFKSITQRAGLGLQYVDSHQKDEIGDQDLTIRLATDGNGNNMSGLFLTPDPYEDVSLYDPRLYTSRLQFHKVYIAVGGSDYKIDDMVRIVFPGNVAGEKIISYTLLKIAAVDSAGTVTEIEIVTDPAIYERYGIRSLGVGHIGSSVDKPVYGPAEDVNPVGTRMDTVNVDDCVGSGLQITILYKDTLNEQVIPGLGPFIMTPEGPSVLNHGGLVIETDTSLCNMSMASYGNYIDESKESTIAGKNSSGNVTGVGSRKIENYSIVRGFKTPDDYIDAGGLYNHSLIGVNLQKMKTLLGYYNPSKYGAEWRFRNMSGMKIMPGSDDIYAPTRSHTDTPNHIYEITHLGIPDGENSYHQKIELNEFNARQSMTGGLMVNVGRFLEIDPSDRDADRIQDYYDIGKVQVRIGEGLNESIRYVKYLNKGGSNSDDDLTDYKPDWNSDDYVYDITGMGDFRPIPKYNIYELSEGETTPENWGDNKGSGESQWYTKSESDGVYVPVKFTYDEDTDTYDPEWISGKYYKASRVSPSARTVAQYGDVYYKLRTNRLAVDHDETLGIFEETVEERDADDRVISSEVRQQLGVKTPLREYHFNQTYKRGQLVHWEFSNKIYLVTKDYVSLEINQEKYDEYAEKLMTDEEVPLLDVYDINVYRSSGITRDIEAGYLSDRFGQDPVVDYEVDKSYPAGQFVLYEGKLYLVIKDYGDYKSVSIEADIDAGYLSNAFNTSIRKVLYFRDTLGRSFTYDPSGTMATQEEESEISDEQRKRNIEYEYVKLGPGLMITGGDVPIETLCDKTELRSYLLQTVSRLSLAESIMYARSFNAAWGVNEQSQNVPDVDPDADATDADTDTSTDSGSDVAPGDTEYPETTLGDVLKFEENFEANLANMAGLDGGTVKSNALRSTRTLKELREFKETLDEINRELENPRKFFPTRKSYLLDDYTTVYNRVHNLLKAANNKVNRTALFQEVVNYFGLGNVAPAYSTSNGGGLAPHVMYFSVPKLEWLFNDWAAKVYEADDATTGFEDDVTSSKKCCDKCDCDCSCNNCSKNPSNQASTTKTVYISSNDGSSADGVPAITLYSSMESNADTLSFLPVGLRLTVSPVSSTTEWYKCTNNGITGYIKKKYVVDPITSADVPSSIGECTTRVPDAYDTSLRKAVVIIRKTQSMTGEKAGVIPLNTKIDTFEVLRDSTVAFNMNWTKVTYDGVTGYIRTELLSFTKVANLPTADASTD